MSIADESTEQADDTAAMVARQRRAEWLAKHRTQYADQYVALNGSLLLGTGKTYREAAKAAQHAGVTNAYIDYVHPPNGEGFMGGW